MNKVTCKCGAVLGEYVDHEGRACLLLGDMLITRAVFGQCKECGEAFDWRATDELLEKILKRRRNGKETV